MASYLRAGREASPEVQQWQHIGERLAIREVGGERERISKELVLLGFGVCQDVVRRAPIQDGRSIIRGMNVHPSPKKMRSTRLLDGPVTMSG